MKVETIKSEILGDIEIHYRKGGKFYAEFKELPEQFKTDEKPPECSTVAELKGYLKLFEEDQVRLKGEAKGIIVINFKSSDPSMKAKQEDYNKSKAWGSSDKFFIENGIGLILGYSVYREYTTRSKVFKRNEIRYENKRSLPKSVPVYEWKERKLYEYVRGMGNGKSPDYKPESFETSIKEYNKMNIILPYSKKTEEFLKRAIESMESMIKAVTDFFNVPSEVLILKLKNPNQKFLN